VQEDRIDGNPYIIHPLETASDLLNKYEIIDIDLIIAALLHDSVEDQPRRIIEKFSDGNIEDLGEKETQEKAFSAIENKNGKRVASIVKGLTNPSFKKIKEDLELQGIKKEIKDLYKIHIGEVISNPDIFVVKLSDFMRNAGNIPEQEPVRTKFILKYKPVIKEVFIPALENMDDLHPLYKKRRMILSELKNLYENLDR
jgi:(p)ppGpp synthase/HD superfamily hydrolase